MSKMCIRDRYYMGTDVGLFRAVLFGGIGFQMLRYTLLGSLLFEYKRCLPVHLHRLLLLLPCLLYTSRCV